MIDYLYRTDIHILFALGLPVVAAIVCFLCGKSDDGRLARRVAVWFAAIQVALSAMIVVSVYSHLESRELSRGRFDPMAIPGDSSMMHMRADGTNSLDSYSQKISGTTEWSLVSFGLSSNDSKSTIPKPDIQFFVGIDGLNLWLIPLTSLIGFIAILLTWKNGESNPGAFLGWQFLLQVGALGAFFSFDIILFFVFFEMTLVPALFLIGQYGVGGTKREAAKTFFLYTLLGGAFTLLGIIATVAINPTPIANTGKEFLITRDSLSSSKPKAGPVTFSIPQLMHNSRIWDLYAARERASAIKKREAIEQQINESKTLGEKIVFENSLSEINDLITISEQRSRWQFWIFLAMMAGFAVKLPIVPFHGWLPAAYSEAPAGITMFLSAILAKLGAFGILRLVLPLCPTAAQEYGMPIFGTLAAIGVVYAALCAFAQSDIKKLAAYSSVSHLGLIVLGAFAVNAMGIGGAAFHMIAHGLSAGLMFGLLAFLADRYQTLDSSRYGGLIGRFPKYSIFFMIAILAGVGLPGLCNFIGEMAVIGSLFDPKLTIKGYAIAVAACSGVFLSAWYSFTMVRKVFFGPVIAPDLQSRQDLGAQALQSTENQSISGDVNPREWLAFAILALGCLVVGLAPQWLIKPMTPEVNLLTTRLIQVEQMKDVDFVNNDQQTWEQKKIMNRMGLAPEDQKLIPIGPGGPNGPNGRGGPPANLPQKP